MAEFIIASERPALRASGTAAPGASTISNVSIRVARVDGRPGPFNMRVWLSDSPLGTGLTAVTASGGVVAGAAGIIVGAVLVAAKAWLVQTDATGVFTLVITDAARTPFVVCIEVEGRTYPVLTLVTANYG